jgi:hypothetical protein
MKGGERKQELRESEFLVYVSRFWDPQTDLSIVYEWLFLGG